MFDVCRVERGTLQKGNEVSTREEIVISASRSDSETMNEWAQPVGKAEYGAKATLWRTFSEKDLRRS